MEAESEGKGSVTKSIAIINLMRDMRVHITSLLEVIVALSQLSTRFFPFDVVMSGWIKGGNLMFRLNFIRTSVAVAVMTDPALIYK